MNKQALQHDHAASNSIFDRIERIAITVMFSAMIVIGILQIISRYITRLPISRTEMLLPNMFVIVVFLALGVAFRQRENIAITYLADALRGRPQQIYRTGVWTIAIGFLAYLAISAASVVQFQMEISAVTNAGLPAALVTAAVPIGCGISILRIIQVEILPVWKKP